jgi:hypothetical protein
MKEYTCARCDYSTKYKNDMRRHLTSKKQCVSKYNNALSQSELLLQLYPKKDDEKKFICTCGKKYSYNESLSRHQKDCTTHKEHKYIISTVNKLENEINVLKKEQQHHIITTNNNSNNITINNTMNNMIVVKDFGDEDLSHLSPKFIENCLGVMSMGMKELTKVIHLNINKPENHNIKVTNIKSPYVSVIKDGKWIYKEKDEALSDLIWKENQILKNHYEDNETDIKRKWTEHKLEYVKRWLDNMDDENPELWSRLKKEIFLILVNNRDIIMDKMSS